MIRAFFGLTHNPFDRRDVELLPGQQEILDTLTDEPATPRRGRLLLNRIGVARLDVRSACRPGRSPTPRQLTNRRCCLASRRLNDHRESHHDPVSGSKIR